MLACTVESDSDGDVNVICFTEPERVQALHVTYGALSILLAFRQCWAEQPSRPMSDAPGGAPTAILTYGYWQRKYNASATAVGKTIIVDGVARQIVGVMPRYGISVFSTRGISP